MPPSKFKLKNEHEAGRFVADALRNKVRNPDITRYQPHEKQVAFHSSQALQRLFIGGNRSGKTVGGCVEDVWWLLNKHPYRRTPNRPVHGRVVGTDFLQGVDKIIKPMIARWLPPSALINGSWEDSYKAEGHTLTLNNKSTLEFMSYDQDLEKFAGTSRDFVHFDEEPPEDIYKECLMRTIDVEGNTWLTLTPIEGMTWIYDTLYLPGLNPLVTNITVVEVATLDNPHIKQSSVDAIASMYDEDELKARLQGKFIQRAGLIYKTFTYEHNTIPPIEDLSTVRDKLWIASLDHGLNNATAWLWSYVDGDGNVVVFDEYKKSNEIVSTHAENVHKINFEHGKIPDYCVGDPSIRNRDPLQGSSVLEEYASYGIYIGLGNNDLKAGYSRVNALISGKQGRRLYIAQNCVELLKEITRLHWATYATKRLSSTQNAKEEQHKFEDHACDSLRYMIMSRPELMDNGKGIPSDMEFGRATYSEQVPFEGRVAKFPMSKRKGYVDPTLGSEW